MSDTRDDIINLFEKGNFPYKGNVFKTKEEEESGENKLEKIKDDYKKFIEYIDNKSKTIDYNVFKNYFDFSVNSALVKKSYKTKNKKENNELVEKIKNRWSDLKDEIKRMSKDEKKN